MTTGDSTSRPAETSALTARVAARHSLKTRITVGSLTIFLLSLWSLSFFASRMLRQDMEQLLGEQQSSTVSYLASEINEELSERIAALQLIARAIPPATMERPDKLQAFLEQRFVLHNLFNGGIVATDRAATVIADTLLSTSRKGVNYRDIDSIAAALNDGKSTVGKPVIGRVLGAPLFSLSVPIVDAQGTVIGSLSGIINLGTSSFLDKITESRYGKTGGYLVVSPKHRLIVTATDKSRIMNAAPPPGTHPAIDDFHAGFSGYAIYRNPRGEEVLGASKHVPVAGWNIVANLPVDEAFAPIHRMQGRMLLATLLLTLLAGGLTRWMLRHELSPLLSTAQRLATLSEAAQPAQTLPVSRPDEIGQLIKGFNHLIATLGKREAALKESDERFSLFMNTLPAAAFIESEDGRPLYINRYMQETMGVQSWPGKSAWDHFSPELVARLVTDEDGPLEAGHLVTEESISNAHGQQRIFQTHKFDIPRQDKAPLIGGIALDVTERRQLEERIRQLAFNDPLTKLPNRRLLEDRLQRALAAARRSGRHGALMFLDLDNFKPLNDRYGHEVGDQLLQEAAARLLQCVRESDTVARFGGDEFVVMLGELDEDRARSSVQATQVAEKIRAALEKPYVLAIGPCPADAERIEHTCTASIGITLFSRGAGTPGDILKDADSAMYRAKQRGRNTTCSDGDISLVAG